MTLPTTIDRVTYQGNGVAIDFATPFKIFAATNLVVTLTEDSTGAVTTQVLNTDYTIVGRVGNEAGNTVRFYTPPAAGFTVRAQRVLPIVQEADFTSQGNFYPERHENALDYVTALVQGVSVDATNALKLSDDGTVWDGESLRITNVADGTSAQDAATLGQLEQVALNLAAGQAAFAPLIWQYTATGSDFVFPLPGATLTRSDAYQLYVDGLLNSSGYSVGVSSSPFVLTMDTIPPAGATIAIRCIGVAEVLSSANIDASGVVSGVFSAARLGSGTPGDDKVLVGGPSGPTWSATINGPLTVSTLNFTTLNGTADASLITTGVFPPSRLGTGVYGVNTVLHGDGVFRIPAVATTTGFGVSDAVNSPEIFTSLEFTGDVADSAEANPINVAKVKTFIKSSAGGTATLEGYVTELFPAAFGLVSGPAVMMQPGNGSDSADWWQATTNDRVLMRRSDSLNFFKVPVAAMDATGTPSSSNYLRGDGTWSAPVASLGSSVATDPNGSTPTYPGTGLFFRGDSQWSNTIDGAFYVAGVAGTIPNLQIGTSLSTVVVDAQSSGGQIPVEWLPPVHVYNSSGTKLSGADTVDRVTVNGRAWAVRHRSQGANMVRLQNTATSGAITLNTNDYGHFITAPSGNVTYTVSDGGADPSTDSYAAESILEVVSPGSNTINFTNVDWAGGISPTFAASGRNMVRLVKRMGVTNWLGTLINSSAAGFTTEDAQDAVGAMAVNTATVALTYSDATPSLAASVVAGSIGPTQLASLAVEESKIAAGAVTNLKVAAGTLTVDRLAATGTRDATTVLTGANTWVPLSSGGGQAAIQFKDEGSNVGSSGAITTVNFTGSGVTAAAAGSTLNVTVTGGGGGTINWADDGFVVGDSTSYPTLSFGSGLNLSVVGGAMRVDATGGGGGGGGGQEPIQFRDEGSAVGSAGAITTFNVVGSGASLSVSGTTATLTVPGSSGGGGSLTGAVFNVKEYGAAGNGVSDDTSSIQAAISAASAAGGGIVLVPAGTYITTGGITVPVRCSLVGAGIGATILKLKNSAVTTADIVRGLGNYVNFADFTIDGNSSNNPTIQRAGLSFADNSRWCIVRNVMVLSNRGFGFALNICKDILFDNCHAVQNKKKQGIWIGDLGGTSERLKFYGCHCIDNDWDGIHVGGNQTEIIGGHFNGNGRDVTDIGTFGACGIYMDPAQATSVNDLVINSVHANDNLESGISVYAVGATISNCIARRNWAAGIVIGGTRGVVTGCYCEGNGLVLSSGHPFWSQPNSFRFIYSGIASNGGAEMVFTGNRCHDLKGTKTQKWGIASETSATGTVTNYLRLTGNMLHGNLVGNSGIETATNATEI